MIGFSMGGAYAVRLAANEPERISAVVSFYGAELPDFSATPAAFQFHFAENDSMVPMSVCHSLKNMARGASNEILICTYPGAQHEFLDEDRAEYDALASDQAWLEVMGFMRGQLP